MYSYILTAHNLSQRHEYGVLAREGLLIELAGIGWVARDHVQAPEQRARVISYVHGHSIVASHSSAYWIYTGNVIPELSRSLHLCNAQQSRSQGFPAIHTIPVILRHSTESRSLHQNELRSISCDPIYLPDSKHSWRFYESGQTMT